MNGDVSNNQGNPLVVIFGEKYTEIDISEEEVRQTVDSLLQPNCQNATAYISEEQVNSLDNSSSVPDFSESNAFEIENLPHNFSSTQNADIFQASRELSPDALVPFTNDSKKKDRTFKDNSSSVAEHSKKSKHVDPPVTTSDIYQVKQVPGSLKITISKVDQGNKEQNARKPAPTVHTETLGTVTQIGDKQIMNEQNGRKPAPTVHTETLGTVTQIGDKQIMNGPLISNFKIRKKRGKEDQLQTKEKRKNIVEVSEPGTVLNINYLQEKDTKEETLLAVSNLDGYNKSYSGSKHKPIKTKLNLSKKAIPKHETESNKKKDVIVKLKTLKANEDNKLTKDKEEKSSSVKNEVVTSEVIKIDKSVKIKRKSSMTNENLEEKKFKAGEEDEKSSLSTIPNKDGKKSPKVIESEKCACGKNKSSKTNEGNKKIPSSSSEKKIKDARNSLNSHNKLKSDLVKRIPLQLEKESEETRLNEPNKLNKFGKTSDKNNKKKSGESEKGILCIKIPLAENLSKTQKYDVNNEIILKTKKHANKTEKVLTKTDKDSNKREHKEKKGSSSKKKTKNTNTGSKVSKNPDSYPDGVYPLSHEKKDVNSYKISDELATSEKSISLFEETAEGSTSRKNYLNASRKKYSHLKMNGEKTGKSDQTSNSSKVGLNNEISEDQTRKSDPNSNGSDHDKSISVMTKKLGNISVSTTKKLDYQIQEQNNKDEKSKDFTMSIQCKSRDNSKTDPNTAIVSSGSLTEIPGKVILSKISKELTGKSEVEEDDKSYASAGFIQCKSHKSILLKSTSSYSDQEQTLRTLEEHVPVKLSRKRSSSQMNGDINEGNKVKQMKMVDSSKKYSPKKEKHSRSQKNKSTKRKEQEIICNTTTNTEVERPNQECHTKTKNSDDTRTLIYQNTSTEMNGKDKNAIKKEPALNEAKNPSKLNNILNESKNNSEKIPAKLSYKKYKSKSKNSSLSKNNTAYRTDKTNASKNSLKIEEHKKTISQKLERDSVKNTHIKTSDSKSRNSSKADSKIRSYTKNSNSETNKAKTGIANNCDSIKDGQSVEVIPSGSRTEISGKVKHSEISEENPSKSEIAEDRKSKDFAVPNHGKSHFNNVTKIPGNVTLSQINKKNSDDTKTLIFQNTNGKDNGIKREPTHDIERKKSSVKQLKDAKNPSKLNNILNESNNSKSSSKKNSAKPSSKRDKYKSENSSLTKNKTPHRTDEGNASKHSLKIEEHKKTISQKLESDSVKNTDIRTSDSKPKNSSKADNKSRSYTKKSNSETNKAKTRIANNCDSIKDGQSVEIIPSGSRTEISGKVKHSEVSEENPSKSEIAEDGKSKDFAVPNHGKSHFNNVTKIPGNVTLSQINKKNSDDTKTLIFQNTNGKDNGIKREPSHDIERKKSSVKQLKDAKNPSKLNNILNESNNSKSSSKKNSAKPSSKKDKYKSENSSLTKNKTPHRTDKGNASKHSLKLAEHENNISQKLESDSVKNSDIKTSDSKSRNSSKVDNKSRSYSKKSNSKTNKAKTGIANNCDSIKDGQSVEIIPSGSRTEISGKVKHSEVSEENPSKSEIAEDGKSKDFAVPNHGKSHFNNVTKIPGNVTLSQINKKNSDDTKTLIFQNTNGKDNGIKREPTHDIERKKSSVKQLKDAKNPSKLNNILNESNNSKSSSKKNSAKPSSKKDKYKSENSSLTKNKTPHRTDKGNASKHSLKLAEHENNISQKLESDSVKNSDIKTSDSKSRNSSKVDNKSRSSYSKKSNSETNKAKTRIANNCDSIKDGQSVEIIPSGSRTEISGKVKHSEISEENPSKSEIAEDGKSKDFAVPNHGKFHFNNVTKIPGNVTLSQINKKNSDDTKTLIFQNTSPDLEKNGKDNGIKREPTHDIERKKSSSVKLLKDAKSPSKINKILNESNNSKQSENSSLTKNKTPHRTDEGNASKHSLKIEEHKKTISQKLESDSVKNTNIKTSGSKSRNSSKADNKSRSYTKKSNLETNKAQTGIDSSSKDGQSVQKLISEIAEDGKSNDFAVPNCKYHFDNKIEPNTEIVSSSVTDIPEKIIQSEISELAGKSEAEKDEKSNNFAVSMHCKSHLPILQNSASDDTDQDQTLRRTSEEHVPANQSRKRNNSQLRCDSIKGKVAKQKKLDTSSKDNDSQAIKELMEEVICTVCSMSIEQDKNIKILSVQSTEETSEFPEQQGAIVLDDQKRLPLTLDLSPNTEPSSSVKREMTSDKDPQNAKALENLNRLCEALKFFPSNSTSSEQTNLAGNKRKLESDENISGRSGSKKRKLLISKVMTRLYYPTYESFERLKNESKSAKFNVPVNPVP